MLEVDDIMLNERIVLDLHHMQYKLPRHRIFCHLGKINKVSHTLVSQRLSTVSLDWNDIGGIVRHNWFFVKVKLYVKSVFTLWDDVCSNFLEGEISIIVGVEKLYWRIKGNRHSDPFVGSERQHFINEYFWKIFGDLDSKGAIASIWGSDSSRQKGIRIHMFEDDRISEANLLPHFTK